MHPINLSRLSSRAARFVLAAVVMYSAIFAAGVTPAHAAPAQTASQAPAAATPVVPVVSTGDSHTCAVNSSGAVNCWGMNTYGELGNGTTTDSLLPVNVKGLASGIKSVSAGTNFTCALTKAGKVKCWGRNDLGQLGNGTTTASLTPVSVIGLPSGITAISAGGFHVCALTAAGGVKCWGANSYGQLGSDSAVVSFSSIPMDVGSLPGVVTAVSAGGIHTCALRSTQDAYCWGRNLEGQLGDGTTTSRYTPVAVVDLDNPGGYLGHAISISAGYEHTCAADDNHNVKCWGDDSYGQLGDGTAADGNRSSAYKVTLEGGGDVIDAVSVSAGGWQTCAVTSTGGARCWGNNNSGQLGDSTTDSPKAYAVQVVDSIDGSTDLSGVTSLDSGGGFNCAVASGKIKCWGYNSSGSLGTGLTESEDYAYPVNTITYPSPISVTLAQGKTSIVLKWKIPAMSNKKEILTYHAQLSKQVFFGTVLREKYTKSTSWPLTGLDPNTSYFVRVRPEFTDGTIGEWYLYGSFSYPSITTSLTKSIKPGAPGLNALQAKPLVKFTWSKPAGTPKTGYQYVLQYGTDQAFGVGTYTEVGDITKTSTSIALTINNPAQTIYWRVKETNADSNPADGLADGGVNYSDWSTVKYFRR